MLYQMIFLTKCQQSSNNNQGQPHNQNSPTVISAKPQFYSLTRKLKLGIYLENTMDSHSWFKEVQKFSRKSVTAIGTVSQLKKFCQSVGKKWGVGHILSPVLE